MKRMLDTNICIYIITGKPASVIERLLEIPPEGAGLSVITVCELRFGASRSSQPKRNHAALDKFLSSFEIAFLDEPVARSYGDIRAALEKEGRSIGPLDLLIASHALSLNASLVTNNAREFERVPRLKVENWV